MVRVPSTNYVSDEMNSIGYTYNATVLHSA